MSQIPETLPAEAVDPEILRLNSEIEADKTAIREACLRLGKAYFDAHKNDAEDVMEDDVKLIRSATEAIKLNQAEILDRKGLMLCPECKAEIAKDAVFCNYCGMRLREPEPEPTPEPEPQPAVCSNCGKELREGQRFCTNCGTPVAAAPDAPKEPELQHCPACGTELPPEARFCFSCGAKL